MADITADGKTRVYWVPTIANIQAPTTTELNAGIALQSTMTADGLSGFNPDTADVDTSALDSTFNTVVNGRTSFSNTLLRLKRQTPVLSDTIFNTLVRDTAGYVAVRRSVAASTAWTSTQPCEVYPALCEEVSRLDPAPNTVERYEVGLKITASPALRSAVA
jgi:hypothetical protein